LNNILLVNKRLGLFYLPKQYRYETLEGLWHTWLEFVLSLRSYKMKRIQLIVLLIITCISGAVASGKYVRVFDFTGGELGQKEPVNSSTIYGLNSGFGYDLGT